MPDEQSGTKRTSVNFVQQNEQEGTKRAYVPHRGQEKITNDSKAKQKKQMVFRKPNGSKKSKWFFRKPNGSKKAVVNASNTDNGKAGYGMRNQIPASHDNRNSERMQV